MSDETIIYLESVVSPGSPFHLAALQVEWEILDVDVARAAENAVTQPDDLDSSGKCSAVDYLFNTIITMKKNKSEK